MIRSNVTLSNSALTRSDFIRYDGCLRYISVINGMTQLMFSKYQHINRADNCIASFYLSENCDMWLGTTKVQRFK